MRSRNIKPGFFSNDQLCDCSMAARLLFIGLWCLADSDGLLEDRPKRIKSQVFPYDQNIDCDSLIDELQRHGLLLRYEAGGIRCISIPNFKKHQNPHYREKPVGLPSPHDDKASLDQSCPIVDPTLGQHCAINAARSALIPSSLNPDSSNSASSNVAAAAAEPPPDPKPFADRGVTPAIFAKSQAANDPQLARKILEFFDASRQWLEKPVGALRSMLFHPDEWGIARDGSGAWSTPLNHAKGKRQVDEAIERMLARRAKYKAEREAARK